MDQRLSLITLGVGDVHRARAFYEALGWHLDGGVDDETDHVAFFQMPGLIVALWDRGKLAEDSGVEDGGGWGGVTLAYNVRSPDEVDAVLDEARAAGASPTATPGRWPTTPAGPCTTTAGQRSPDGPALPIRYRRGRARTWRAACRSLTARTSSLAPLRSPAR
jgi:catechol 2,3-dioxygenase-like lactoylglutathione lyase family enzyme